MATRLSVVGALALIVGSSLVAGVVVQALTSSAYADTSAYETFCGGTPAGNIVLNDVVVTGSLSPAAPTTGQQFNVTGLQVQEQLPASIVTDAEATGLTSLTGTLTTTVDATGATPPSISTGSMPFDIPLPNPVPSTGVALDVPSTPATVGPFTATSDNITVSEAPTENTTDIDGDGIGQIALTCSSYPNDILPSGFSNNTPPGLPFSPLIASAGQSVPPPAPPALTGPYELYCPHTPVGDLVFNDVVTMATISPSSLTAGQHFNVTGYQTHIPLPAGLAAAAAGLGNSSFDGVAASSVDAYGATASSASTGSMSFDVPIPSTVPAAGLGIDFPTSPTTVGPFTASGGTITMAQDQSTLVVAALSSKAFRMSCAAYANDSVANSGSTGTAPTGQPIRPVIAIASASGTSPAPAPGPIGPQPPVTGPYEMYCPGSPVGDLVLNDTTTTATITPSTLSQGQQFSLDGLQTQFSIPQAVAQRAEDLGLTQITGDELVFPDTTGVDDFEPVPIYNPGTGTVVFTGTPTTVTTGTVVGTGTGVSSGPIEFPPIPFPGPLDLSFDVTLPNPVPASGVQFTATPPAGLVPTFTAAGGPIQFDVSGVNLDVTEFGDTFGMFCNVFPNDTEPTGLSNSPPALSPVQAVIATGQATITPPPPIGPGGEGPYELYCPETPVGNIVLNDVTTSATLSPSTPLPGQQFSVTGYQTQVPLPSSIASAAAALGNTVITGTASATLDAEGATPASIPTGPLSFDAPLPFGPGPVSGVNLDVPSTPTTIGPFTATTSPITIAQNAETSLTLSISGAELDLNCTAYPNDSAASGITVGAPNSSPISPVLVVGGVDEGHPPVPTTQPGSPPTTMPPPGPSGLYELYCPGTPVGNVVLNGVTTTASIPTDLVSGQSFDVSDFQTQLTLPASIASAAAALGNTAITGSAALSVDGVGVTPSSISSGSVDINVPLPSPVPSTGVTLTLPDTPGTVGPFTATGGEITMSLDSTINLTLVVSGSQLVLTCHPYPNNSAPSGIVSGEPFGPPLSPVIAAGSTGGGSSTPTGEITQDYETLFSPSASIADKVAVIENGASIETALQQALTSSLASTATGVQVTDVTFPDSSGCTQAGLSSPCADVAYAILGPNGSTVLVGNQGLAVSVNGTWLIATKTACSLLELFYQAAGRTGSPPGCPSTSGSTPTTIDPTATQASTGPGSASAAGGSGTSTTNPPTTTSTPTTHGGGATGAASDPSPAAPSSTAGASATPAPVVEASSGSLAFTGLGEVAEWLAIVGGALMVLGFALLTVVDAPRRLVSMLAHTGPLRRRHPRHDVSRIEGALGTEHRSARSESLWISGRYS